MLRLAAREPSTKHLLQVWSWSSQKEFTAVWGCLKLCKGVEELERAKQWQKLPLLSTWILLSTRLWRAAQCGLCAESLPCPVNKPHRVQ